MQKKTTKTDGPQESLIEGLYEAHLPVSDLERSRAFYAGLGLRQAWEDEDTVFFWIEEGKSWIGLWLAPELAALPYHPAIRHAAFRVDWEGLLRSAAWLKARGIEPAPFGRQPDAAPFVRPHQANASIYFDDPDGNSLELMCSVEVPADWREHAGKIPAADWPPGNGGTA